MNDTDKIHGSSARFDVDHHLTYLLGYAERAGSVVISHALMDEIVATVSYYRSKALHLEAKEARREEREKRRKKD